jgi:hypothetical protein
MKKFLSILLTLATLAISSPSHAIVGIASDSEATAIAGLALMDLSRIFVVESRTTYRRGRRGGFGRTSYVTYRIITYPAFLIAGLVLLDDEGTAEISGELSPREISQAGLTNNEVDAFKAEIEEINAIKDMVSSGISRVPDDEKRLEMAGQLWTEYSKSLSNNAAIALHKLSNFQ